MKRLLAALLFLLPVAALADSTVTCSATCTSCGSSGSGSFDGGTLTNDTCAPVLQVPSSGAFNFSSGACAAASDTGLARQSASIVMATNGSTGLGNLFGSTIFIGGVQATSNASITAPSAGILASTGRWQMADGTSSAPAYGFSGDTDIGMYRNGSNLAFTVDSGQYMHITSAGPVMQLGSGVQLSWANTASSLGAGGDTGLARVAAGIVNVTNGGAGFGTLRTSSLQVGNGSVGWCTGGGCSVIDVQISRAGGAGGLAVTNSALNVPFFIKFALEVTANTGTATPGILDSTKMFTNTGDADGSTITLPNDPTIGTVFEFALTVAQTMTINASAGETIQDGATSGTSTSANAIGATLRLVAVTGGSGAIWMVTSKQLTWTVV